MDIPLDVNSEAVHTIATYVPHDPSMLISGIILIAAAFLIVVFLKRVLVNLVLGLIALLVLYFIGISLPLVPTLVVTVIFGLAGVGTMLILHFFGII